MTAFALQPEYIRDKTYTVEEYFELEKHSEIRHEFVNGKLIAMPGESVIANRIADNCGFNLRLHLNKKGYDTIRHDVRTMIRNGKLYRYPDVSVAKRSEITQTHAVTKPEMLIEVTSENSSTTDHDAKVKEYTALPSLQYYLIVSRRNACRGLQPRQLRLAFRYLCRTDGRYSFKSFRLFSFAYRYL